MKIAIVADINPDGKYCVLCLHLASNMCGLFAEAQDMEGDGAPMDNGRATRVRSCVEAEREASLK